MSPFSFVSILSKPPGSRGFPRPPGIPPGPPVRAALAGALLATLPLHGWVGAAAASPVAAGRHPDARGSVIATFSCVGYDPETRDLGVVVQSKFFAVGSVVPWAKADVGAIASQAFGNTTFGPGGLALLEQGKSAEETLQALVQGDSLRERRQVGILDARGRSATYTGKECQPWAGGIAGENFAAQGNILVSEATVKAMADAFAKTRGILGDRLMAALEAGQAAGGDSRGMQSAAILIVRKGGGYAGYNDRYCDLRVDDARDPIAELRRIYNIWKPNALVTEGYTLVEKKEFERAYALGREAISLRPQDGEPRYHLACYYSRGGNAEKALQLLGEALERDPSLARQASSDTDLAPLKSDARFQSILSRAEKSSGKPAGKKS